MSRMFNKDGGVNKSIAPLACNFDNSATTFPKPNSVKNAVSKAVSYYGGNPGRGGHSISLAAAEVMYSARETVAEFFGAQSENIIFTMNCTHALNMAIKGVVKEGSHIVISSLEHNSVSRPVAALSAKGLITYTVARVYPEKEKTIDSFRQAITDKTTVVVCTAASNVTGQILPFREIGEICRLKGICFIVDGAQVCGVIPINLSDGINIICTAGHKGLYGITGTGLLVSDGKYKIQPIIEGGTGSSSLDLEQPDFLPDALESGTGNVIGAAALKAGIDFVNEKGIRKIHDYENMLCSRFLSGLYNDNRVKIYRDTNAEYIPIVSFNIMDGCPEDVARYLDSKGFCLRAGLHCAALAHKTLGTIDGTVRFAPSVFNTEENVYELIKVIKKYDKKS